MARSTPANERSLSSRERRPDEQRRFRRRMVHMLIDYITPESVRCEYATTLAAGGLFIETEEPLPVGTRLKLRFALPGGETLHVIEGRVARVQAPGLPATTLEPPGLGIEFCDAHASAQLARELDDLAS